MGNNNDIINQFLLNKIMSKLGFYKTNEIIKSNQIKLWKVNTIYKLVLKKLF